MNRYNQIMNYYLAKTEPSTYSIDDLRRKGIDTWEGVHNFQAIAFIKTMQPGDRVYIYHSQVGKSIVGLAEVASEPYLNTADPRTSWMTDMKFIKKYPKPLTLADIKASADCADFLLVRNPRLSVMPVPARAQAWIAAELGDD